MEKKNAQKNGDLPQTEETQKPIQVRYLADDITIEALRRVLEHNDNGIGVIKDVRHFIEKYQRYWLKSEQERAFKELRGQYDNKREVSDRKDNDELIWIREQSSRTGSGLSCEQEEIASNPFERQEEMFLRP